MQTPALIVVGIFMLIAGNHAAVQIDQYIRNRNVERNIDVTTQLVKIQYKITLEHSQKREFAGDAYTIVIPLAERKNLSYILISDALKKDLKPVEEETPQGAAFTVKVASATSTPVLTIEAIFTKSLRASPTHIGQSERQLVEYHGDAYFYSPYKTISQKTVIQLASKSVESFTPNKAVTHNDNKVTYGPFEAVDGMTILRRILSTASSRFCLNANSSLCSMDSLYFTGIFFIF